MSRTNDKRGNTAALWAGIGAALGIGVGVAFVGALGIISIVICAFLGAVFGMVAGFVYEKRDSE